MKWIFVAMLALTGCMDGPNTECERICGKGAMCSIARPDEPRRARITVEKDERGPAIDFAVMYSGVICSFIYNNSIEPKLNFSIGKQAAMRADGSEGGGDG